MHNAFIVFFILQNILLDPLSIFAPSIEAVVDQNTFLHKHPYEILKAGEQNDVPWITGLNSDEGLLFTASMNCMNILYKVPVLIAD